MAFAQIEDALNLNIAFTDISLDIDETAFNNALLEIEEEDQINTQFALAQTQIEVVPRQLSQSTDTVATTIPTSILTAQDAISWVTRTDEPRDNLFTLQPHRRSSSSSS
ncbi:hypothetical protein, partial [Salmonella enterica]